MVVHEFDTFVFGQCIEHREDLTVPLLRWNLAGVNTLELGRGGHLFLQSVLGGCLKMYVKYFKSGMTRNPLDWLGVCAVHVCGISIFLSNTLQKL